MVGGDWFSVVVSGGVVVCVFSIVGMAGGAAFWSWLGVGMRRFTPTTRQPVTLPCRFISMRFLLSGRLSCWGRRMSTIAAEPRTRTERIR